MKKIILLLAFLIGAHAQAESFVTGDQILTELQGINYDYDWTGSSTNGKLACRLTVDAEYEKELSISISHEDEDIGYRVFSLTSEMVFSKTKQQEEKVTYTEMLMVNNPYSPVKVIEVVYDKKAGIATVTLKNNSDDFGADCTVAYDP